MVAKQHLRTEHNNFVQNILENIDKQKQFWPEMREGNDTGLTDRPCPRSITVIVVFQEERSILQNSTWENWPWSISSNLISYCNENFVCKVSAKQKHSRSIVDVVHGRNTLDKGEEPWSVARWIVDVDIARVLIEVDLAWYIKYSVLLKFGEELYEVRYVPVKFLQLCEKCSIIGHLYDKFWILNRKTDKLKVPLHYQRKKAMMDNHDTISESMKNVSSGKQRLCTRSQWERIKKDSWRKQRPCLRSQSISQ